MSLFKAAMKLAARTLNDTVLKHDIKNAHTKAYANTGKRLNHAKANNYRIDGAKSYRKSRSDYVSKAKARHNNRDKFISDI